jgi:hypothetical protein
MSLVTDFIKNNGRNYKPGSDTHLNLRRNYIGCSELYKATGTINMVKNIIKGKLIPQQLNILPVTHGIHFEDNCEEYLKHILKNNRIYKAPGSILNQKLPNIACSPDGLGYINVENFDKYKVVKKNIEYVSIRYNSLEFNEMIQSFSSKDNDVEVPCLFEYKSPFSRKIKNGYISLDYEYQIQGGMQVVDICQYACFFESVFKLCSLGQLFCDWCYDMNYILYECVEDYTEIAKGIKLYFLKPEFFNRKDVNTRLVNMLEHFNNPLYEKYGVDFGTYDYFKSFFVGLNESMYTTVNLPMYIKNDTNEFVNINNEVLSKDNILDIVSEYTNDNTYIGYACWKLYDYQIIIQKRKNIINESILERCGSIMDCIQQIDGPEQIEFIKLKNNNVVL